ncbi:MAG: major tail protein [Cellulosilyticaceae bacterium]
MSTVGCDRLHYAVMKDEKSETYDKPIETKYVKGVDLNPSVEKVNNYYNDGLGETASALKEITVTLDVADLTEKEVADLLGAETDSKGVLISCGEDAPPYVALMFRSLKGDLKNYRYVCLYKGKFSLPQESYQTKGEKLEYQGKKLVGTFMLLDKKIDGKRRWKSIIDSDDIGEDISKVIEEWFKAPYGEPIA